MAFAACNKENNIEPAASGRKIVLTVNDNITKTAYAPGTGVKLTGTEKIGLFYRFNEGEQTGRWNGMAATGQAKPVIATPSEGQYTFSIPAGAQYTEWTGILPYSSQNTFTDSNGLFTVVRLSSVQCPGANTFDPAYDYLIAKNFEINEGEGTAEITQFVRLFTPLRLQIKGLAEGEKIFSVTFATNQTASVPDEGDINALVGQFIVRHSDDADQAGLLSMEYEKSSGAPTGNFAFGNAVSAVYADGLEAIDGAWPVWFMVNPGFMFNADSKVTVTVNTADAQYVRTITIPEDTELGRNQLNNIAVNIKGAGYSKVEDVVLTQVFNAATSKASDGKSYSWTGSQFWNATEASRDAGSFLASGCNFTSRDVTIPAVTDYKISRIRAYAHPVTNAKYATDSYLSLKNAEGELAKIPFNFCTRNNVYGGADYSLYTTGGVVDIECPDGVDNLAGLTLKGTNNCLMTAVAYYLKEDKKEYEEATGNDLWAEWNAGKKITINGVEYTKDAYPAADLIDLSVTDNYKKAQVAGLHFLTGKYSTGGASAHLTLPNGIILISRYKDTPAELEAGQFKMASADYVFHYMKFSSLNTNNAFPNNATVNGNSTLLFSKCNIVAKGGIVRDVNATYCYDSIIFDSCNISYNANSLYFVNNKTAASATPHAFTLKDSTVNSGASEANAYVQGFVSNDLDIIITGNTFTLGSVTKFFNIKSRKSLVWENNTGYDGELGATISNNL